MDILEVMMLLLGVVCCLSFIWAVRWHFVRHSGMRAGMRILSLFTLFGFSWFLYSSVSHLGRSMGPGKNASDFPAYLAATVLIIVSLCLFWCSVAMTRVQPLTLAFALDAPTYMHVRGPYAYVRHPFYSSYVIFWLATAVAERNLLGWLILILMTALYSIAAKREEKKFALSPLAATYSDYRGRTGMLIPILWNRGSYAV